MNEYDLIAIGSGPAGESATELASFFGLRALVVERNRPGGTVTATGGVPTKTLRDVAVQVAGLRAAAERGLRVSAPVEVVIDAIRRRTSDACERLTRMTGETLSARGVDYLHGTARLERGRRVVVTDEDGLPRALEAKAVVIATGSRPSRPRSVSFDLPGVCDTDTILRLGRVPKDLVIVGGGAVGVEFATICRALGAEVRLLERDARPLATMDREIVDRLLGAFERSEVTVSTKTTLEGVTAKDGGLEVVLSDGTTVAPDTVLFAAGRVPNTEGLGLEDAGVAVDARGRIVVDEWFRTSAEGIWAAGDVVRPTLASIAMEQGRAAFCRAFGVPFEGTVDPCPVSAVYSMPELSGAGLTEEQCRESKLDYEVGRADLDQTPRGVIAGRGGLLKLIFSKHDRRLLGVHCIADIASELVGIGQMVIRCGGTLDTIANMSMNTPTYGYAYKYAAFDGLRRAPRGPPAGGAR